MAGKKQKYYVVWYGREPGIYTSWEECVKQTSGFKGAKYKAYPTPAEAEQAFIYGPEDERPADEATAYRTLRIHIPDDGAVRRVVAAANEAVELRSFREIIPSMNDIFIRAVNGQL